MTTDVDTQQMIDAILRQKMNLSRDALLQMIEEKKQKIGAGYLTDHGALFLVAADLGVVLEQVPKLEMSLKNIYAGSKEVTVIAGVMNIYPLKKYRRKDGSEASLRTLVVYDSDTRLRVKLWDEMAVLPDKLGIKQGDVLRISKAYTRSGMDGRITINAGARTSIDLIEEDLPHVPDLDSLAKDPSEITGSEDDMIVIGLINNSPRLAGFTNARGKPSKVLHMKITGADDKMFRVVLWNVDEERIPKIMKLNSKIKLVGLRTKQGRYGDTELHGDEGTIIELMEDRQEIEIMPLRIISVYKGTKRQEYYVLAFDRSKNNFAIVADEIFAQHLRPNSIVECIPSRIYGTTLLLRDDAYLKTIEDDPSFPSTDSLEKKIKDVKPSQDLYFIEAITLSPGKVQDIQLKDGSQVKHGEVMLGDDSAEMRLTGWRETADTIGDLGIGQRVKVYGVDASTGRDGNTELRLKPFSNVIRLGQ